MRIRKMDDMLLEINSIKNIRYIKIYDLLISRMSDNLLLPAILINYDGKTINLCSKDDYFDELINKVIEVYNDEKNKVYVDDFGREKKIEIDDESKKILLSGNLTKNSKYDLYKKKEKYDDNFIFQIDEVRLLIPIIKYQLELFVKLVDKVLILDSDIYGYKDNYNMRCKINGLDSIIILNYIKIDNCNYRIDVRGLLGKVISNTITINRDRIEIVSNVDNISYMNSLYTNSKRFVSQVRSDGRRIAYEDHYLSEVDNPISNLIDSDYTFYALPWGGYLGSNITRTELDSNAHIYTNDLVYYLEYNDSFVLRNFYYKEYKKDKKDNTIVRNMLLDNLSKDIYGIKVSDDVYLISTYFDQVGFYKNIVSNKYFYHLVRARNIEEIDRRNIIGIDKKEFLDRTDVLDTERIGRVMK